MKWMRCIVVLTLLLEPAAKADVVCNVSGCFHRHEQRGYYGRDDYYGEHRRDDYPRYRRYRDDQRYRSPPTCAYVGGVRICSEQVMTCRLCDGIAPIATFRPLRFSWKRAGHRFQSAWPLRRSTTASTQTSSA